MGSMVSGNQASAKHMSGRFLQTFPNVRNLLVDPEKDAELRNKRMDRIVNP